LDSGAFDHMAFQEKFIFFHTTISHFMPIKIPDRSFIPTKSLRDVYLTSLITLKDVLHIPSFSCYLISISKLTKALNCVAYFFTRPTHEEADWNG